MSRLTSWTGRGVRRTVTLAVVAAALLAAVGAVYAGVGGHAYRSSIVSAIFFGGGVVVVLNAFAGGGARGRIADYRTSGGRRGMAQPMPFGGVLIGLLVIGIGLLVLAVWQ